jgi:hypothetical protein
MTEELLIAPEKIRIISEGGDDCAWTLVLAHGAG